MSNLFSFGKVKLNKRKGTAAVQVKLPGAGKLVLVGSKTVKTKTVFVKRKSTITVTVKATGKAASTLKKKRQVKVKATFRFTPSGGKARTKSKSVTLRR